MTHIVIQHTAPAYVMWIISILGIFGIIAIGCWLYEFWLGSERRAIKIRQQAIYKNLMKMAEKMKVKQNGKNR